jgi:hypothetical protein
MRLRTAIAALVLLTPVRSAAVSSSGCVQRSPKRSLAVIREFKHTHPCPATGKGYGACPGYQIDHVVPLCCGGADAPFNMRWLTTDAHKARHAHGIICIVGHPRKEET